MMLGDKIRMLRAQRGWSQEGLGLACGIPQKTISHYELNHYMPQLCNAVKICEAFKITLNDLMEGVDLT